MDLKTQEHKEYYKYNTRGKQILFYVPNGPCLWRAMTIDTKEPWTLDWIDTFQSNDTLWDIGANVGLFSLYAASRGTKVFAFEPEAANYRVLNENIRINNMDNIISAYCLAISDNHTFGKLRLSKIETAASGHQFNGNNKPAFSQACISYTMDMLYDILGPPTHIKIDVDGIEPMVIAGGLSKVLPSVKSIMVELSDEPSRAFLKQLLIDKGFKWHPDIAERSTHKHGDFKGVGEHLFTR